MIEKILEGNAAGFVKTSEGKQYYFSMREAKSLKHKVVVGCPVSFDLEDGFDKKKQVATKNAVRLTLKV